MEILKCAFFIVLCFPLAAVPRFTNAAIPRPRDTYLDLGFFFVYAVVVFSLLDSFGIPAVRGLCDHVYACESL